MLEPIFIDTMALSNQFTMTQENVESLKKSAVDTVTTVVLTCWQEQAKKKLNSTREQYMNALGVRKVGAYSNIISLAGEFPNMLEQGADPFNMKKGFQGSEKAIETKDKDGNLGWYLTIPFTWAQPTSLGESQAFTGVLPQDVSSALKTAQKERGQEAILNLGDIPEEFQIPEVRPQISLTNGTVFEEYVHKNSNYEGLQQKEKGGTVMSFRRVSNNSDDNSWIHTGIDAYNLADKAVEDANIPEVVGSVIDKFLDQLIG